MEWQYQNNYYLKVASTYPGTQGGRGDPILSYNNIKILDTLHEVIKLYTQMKGKRLLSLSMEHSKLHLEVS